MDNAEVTKRKGVGLFFRELLLKFGALSAASKRISSLVSLSATLATFACIPLGKVRNLV